VEEERAPSPTNQAASSLCDARATDHLSNLINLKRESRERDRADEAA
jgi:hypothetical protein